MSTRGPGPGVLCEVPPSAAPDHSASVLARWVTVAYAALLLSLFLLAAGMLEVVR